MSILIPNIGDNKLPYVLANMISDYINIEYVQDFYGIRDLDYDGRVLLNNLRDQTGQRNPDVKLIEQALNEKDHVERFDKLIKLNMYYAACAMIRDDLIIDTFRIYAKLFNITISRKDFDAADKIAELYHDRIEYDVAESASIFPTDIFNHWIKNGNEDQKNYVVDNYQLFLSDYDGFYDRYDILEKLYNYGYIDQSCELLDSIIGEFSNDEGFYDGYIMKYAVLLPGYEGRIIRVFTEQYTIGLGTPNHPFFEQLLDENYLIEGWREKLKEKLIAGNADRDILGKFL